jgi:hypothetical protein
MRVWKQRYVAVNDSPVTPVTSAPVTKPSLVAQQQEIGALVLELLAAKLKASRAIADAAADPEWLKRHSPADVAPLAQWLDSTAFAIGDRLAGAADRQRTTDDPRPALAPAEAERAD